MKSFFEYVKKENSVKKVLAALLGVILFLVVFQAGMFIGFHKASFAFRGGENYYRAFDRNGKRANMGMMDFDDVPGGHGAIGKVISIASTTLVVSAPDNIEKIIHILPDTLVKKFRDAGTSTDIVIGDYIVVIGNPNEKGQVDAKLIRIMPAPGTMMFGTSTDTK